MDDDNLHTPEGWHIVELEAKIKQLRVAMQDAYNHLMNLQPHIEMLHKNSQPFIDSHVDCAMEKLKAALNEPLEEEGDDAKRSV